MSGMAGASEIIGRLGFSAVSVLPMPELSGYRRFNSNRLFLSWRSDCGRDIVWIVRLISLSVCIMRHFKIASVTRSSTCAVVRSR